MKNLQEFLIQKRKELKLSLRDAAKLIGMSHSYLSTLEKGIDPRNNVPVKPTPETLQLISNAYGISYNYLMELAGYITTNTNTIHLNRKDERDIEKATERFLAGLEGGAMLNGEILDEEDLELFKQAVKNGLTYAKISNKKKYTNKRYRKDNK
jgi:transcriptional regulator with XRE-family HTH domain